MMTQSTKIFNFDSLDYYHGLLPVNSINELTEENGDFLLYSTPIEDSTSKGLVKHMLCVKWNDEPIHVEIIYHDKQNCYRFDESSQGFQSIEVLIRYYYDKVPVPSKDRQLKPLLKRVIKREKWELGNDDIKLGKELGAGNFGKVFEGELIEREIDGTQKGRNPIKVAIKLCDTKDLSPLEKLKFLEEARTMKHYNHPNVVRLIGVCSREPIMIVMEIVTGGSLDKYLRKNKEISNKERIKFSLDASKGMAYLEAKQCIHRDLAARNCLLAVKGLPTSERKAHVVQISDFGMSREGTEYKFSIPEVLPLKWTAPESFNKGRYTSKSDVWSYAILLWEIFSGGKSPYSTVGLGKMKVTKFVNDGNRMPIPDNIPCEVASMIEKCWQFNPDDRPSFKDIQKEFSTLYKTKYMNTAL